MSANHPVRDVPGDDGGRCKRTVGCRPKHRHSERDCERLKPAVGYSEGGARLSTGTKYEPIGKERFTLDHTERGEVIKIKAPRQIFVMLFLPFWLVMWTFGGVAAVYALVTEFQVFLLFWLCGWAVGWIAAAGTLLWMFAGSETISVRGRDIEVWHQALGFSKRWLYQGSQIRNLSIASQPAWPFQFRWQVPFMRSSRNGSIKFDYGPRTIFVAPGLDEGEARMIVERLARKLPTSGASG